MEKKISYIILLIGVILALCSCERNVAKPVNGQENSEMSLYYNYGLKPGMLVVATDSFYINREPKSRFSGKTETINYQGIKDFKMGVDDFRGARIHKGDTLEIMGGFVRTHLKNGKDQDFIQVSRLKSGETVDSGWNCFGISLMARPDNSWTAIFSSNSQERMVNMATLLVCLLAVLAVYLVWLFVYWLVVDKIKGGVCFWSCERIISRPLLYIVSVVIGFIYFLIDHDKSLTYFLRFNPDIFATWSEQPLCVKILPFIAAVWIAVGLIMLVEMIVKFKTPWLVIYYPGKLATGLLIICATIMGSWLIYIFLPGVIALTIASFSGGNAVKSGRSHTVNGTQTVNVYKNGKITGKTKV